MTDPNPRPARYASPLVLIDKATAELSSDQESYEFVLGKIEEIATDVLEDEGIELGAVCIQAMTDESDPPTERASKAISAIISVRLLREWEFEAVEQGHDTAEKFYHVAHNAIMACTAATLVSPMVSSLETVADNLSKAQKKGGQTTPKAAQREHELIKIALLIIWRKGARYTTNKHWAREVVKMHPELRHPNDALKSFSTKVRIAGTAVFGDDWLIWAHNGPTA